jgi:hypothetical protein
MVASLISKQILNHVIVFLECLGGNPDHKLDFRKNVHYVCADMSITLCSLVTSAVHMKRLTDMTTAPPSLEKLGFKDRWMVVLMISHKFCEEIPRHSLEDWLVHLNDGKDHCCYMETSELRSLELSALQALDFKILPSHEEFCKVTDGLDAVELQTRIGKPLRTLYGVSRSKQHYSERTDVTDDGKIFRVVECSRFVNPSRIFTELEWRGELKITMSRGWTHLFTSILDTRLMVFVRDANEKTQEYEFIFQSPEKCRSTGAP